MVRMGDTLSQLYALLARLISVGLSMKLSVPFRCLINKFAELRTYSVYNNPFELFKLAILLHKIRKIAAKMC